MRQDHLETVGLVILATALILGLYGVIALIGTGRPTSVRGWVFAFTVVPFGVLLLEGVFDLLVLPAFRRTVRRGNAALAQVEHALQRFDLGIEERWRLKPGRSRELRILVVLATPLVLLLVLWLLHVMGVIA